MFLNTKIQDVIACPICKGKLDYDKTHQVLVCKFNKLIFPIKHGVPIMLAQEARSLEGYKRRSNHKTSSS